MAWLRGRNWNKNQSQGFVGKRKSNHLIHQRRFKNHTAAKLTVALVHCTWRSWRWLLTEAFQKRNPQTVVWKLSLWHHWSNIPSPLHTLHHTKPWTTILQSSKAAIKETRIEMDASCKHTYIPGVALKLKSHVWEMRLYLCSGQTYTHVRNSWVVRFEAVKYKLSHSSY